MKTIPTPSKRKTIKMTNKRTGRPIPDPDTIEHEGPMNATPQVLDSPPPADVQSNLPLPSTEKDPTMNTEDHSGYKETMNDAAPAPLPTKQELAAEKAQAKIAAKLAKAEAAEAAKMVKEQAKEAALIAKNEAKAVKDAAKLEAIQSKNTSTKEEREAAKAERLARLAALDPDGTKKYHGSMLALADRVKQGAYVKAVTGQLCNGDDLATALSAVPVDNVIRLAKIVLELPENPYTQLNVGQQSMNFRNRMRGALTKGTITMDQIRSVIADNDFATATDWEELKAKKAAARATKSAEIAAAKLAKAAEKEAEPA